VVIVPVGDDPVGFLTRPADPACNRRDAVDELEQDVETLRKSVRGLRNAVRQFCVLRFVKRILSRVYFETEIERCRRKRGVGPDLTS
jgi:hypothetical protein